MQKGQYPTSPRRRIVWCPGVDELVGQLPELAESGRLESDRGGDNVAIADESGQTPEARLVQRAERQARIAYYAHGKMTDGRDQRGVPLPDWANLPPSQRALWFEVARSVRMDTLNPDWATQTGADNPVAPWRRVETEPGAIRGGNDA